MARENTGTKQAHLVPRLAGYGVCVAGVLCCVCVPRQAERRALFSERRKDGFVVRYSKVYGATCSKLIQF